MPLASIILLYHGQSLSQLTVYSEGAILHNILTLRLSPKFICVIMWYTYFLKWIAILSSSMSKQNKQHFVDNFFKCISWCEFILHIESHFTGASSYWSSWPLPINGSVNVRDSGVNRRQTIIKTKDEPVCRRMYASLYINMSKILFIIYYFQEICNRSN